MSNKHIGDIQWVGDYRNTMKTTFIIFINITLIPI